MAHNTNVYEHSARSEKARRLIAAIDGVLPHIYARTPEMALDAVLDMGDVGWSSAASIAGVNLPSDETREIVLDTYRRRVRASVDAQIAESIAGALKSAGGGRCLHLNREHVGPGHRDRCNDCGATSYVRRRDARIEWEAAR